MTGYQRRERPAPVVLHDGLVVPGDSAAELAAALDLLDAYLHGRQPLAAVKQQPQQLTRAQLAIREAARTAAARYRQQETERRSWAAPTVPHAPVLVPAQLGGSSALVSTETAAAASDFSSEWVRRLVASGRVRGHRGPRDTWEVDLNDVLAYRDRTTRRPTDGRPGDEDGRGAA